MVSYIRLSCWIEDGKGYTINYQEVIKYPLYTFSNFIYESFENIYDKKVYTNLFAQGGLSRLLTEQELDQLADRVIMRMNPQVNKDNVFHNTKLLLDNYHKLKAHVATVNEQLNEDANTFWGHHHLNLNSLMQNKAKTVKLMKHVDESIETYRRMCKDNCSRGYALIYQKYLADYRRTDENIA